MTWAEFCIKSFAHNRIQTRQWEQTRWISYHALIAPYQGDGRKIPRDLNAFLRLDNNSNSEPNQATAEQRERFLELAKQYYGRYSS